jgi:outer membrane protein TolC
MKFRAVSMLTITGILLSSPGFAITMEEYIGQVELKNGGIRATKISAEAKSKRSLEGALFFKPSFFFNGEYYDDQRPTNAPAFQGSQTIRRTLQAGLSQNFRLGTKASISYNYYHTQIIGAGTGILAQPKFYDLAPKIDITQSLWRNFLGSEFEAAEKAQIAAVEAGAYADTFARKQLLVQAENAYWRLYFAQTSLKVQEASLERAKKLRDWNSNRVRSNLVDEVELLQAEANLQNRELEYQDTISEVDTALKDFNSIREDQGDIKLEGTKDQAADYILNASLPQKSIMREDVLAFQANQKVAVANAALGTERNKPVLEVYGSYSMNGRNKNYSEAWDQSMTGTRPFSIIGLRFVTPLALGEVAEYKKAFAQEVVASEMSFKRKTYEVEREWDILSSRFENFKKRLTLAQKLEKVQERKLFNEKRRFNQGRTTTFQVLQFEQDFANAQLLKLRNERELITVYNNLKLFSGVDHESK